MAKNYDPRRSSVAVGEEKKKKRGGLLWLLLGLLLAILLIGLLISSCGDDDDETAATTSAPAATTPSTPTTEAAPATPAPDDDADASASGGAAAAAGAGTLTASSQSLLGSDAPAIGDQVGRSATGTGVKVLSVSEGGFFVGTDDSDRQFVEYAGTVGEDEKSGAELPAVGDVVDLKGPVRPAPEDPAQTLKLSEADAKTLTERGSYVNADSVTPNTG